MNNRRQQRRNRQNHPIQSVEISSSTTGEHDLNQPEIISIHNSIQSKKITSTTTIRINLRIIIQRPFYSDDDDDDVIIIE